MSTPTVQEVTRRPDPVDHDTFIEAELTRLRRFDRASLTRDPDPDQAEGAG